MVNTFTSFDKIPTEYRREELIRKIEHSLALLTDGELEALYYDMRARDYLKD